jgi:integrase
VIARYRQSDDYRDLAPGTVKYYKRYLRDIEALGPALSFAGLTRQVVVDFLDTFPARHQRRQCAAVLKALFRLTRYHGLVMIDQAAGLRLKTTAPRERIWSDAESVAWLKAAEIEDPHMTTGFLILLHTAQRPGDILKMTWPQYSGGAIRLRQQKTNKLLDVPIAAELARHLDAVPRAPRCLTIVSYRGRPVSYSRFRERFAQITAAAGIAGAQARDLRRTAMVNMALAGATVPQIASVSGHSIEATARILETYLPRNRALADAAITRLDDHRAARRRGD